MNKAAIGIVERLNVADRSHRSIQGLTAAEPTLLSESAAIIMEMVEALEADRKALKAVEQDFRTTPKMRNLAGAQVLAIDTLITKVRGK